MFFQEDIITKSALYPVKLLPGLYCKCIHDYDPSILLKIFEVLAPWLQWFFIAINQLLIMQSGLKR